VNSDRLDALVVGAGPGGSSTALRLARAGLAVLLIDRAGFPRDKPCSEYMSPETVRRLAALGIGPELERAGGTALDGTTVTGPDGSALTGVFARISPAPGARGPAERHGQTGLALPRRVLDAVLVAAAERAGADVRQQVTVVDLLRDRNGVVDGVRVRHRGGSITDLRARIVVGADGLGSVVARRAGLSRRRRMRLKRMAFVAHVDGVTGLTHTAELHVGRRGYVGINPLGGDLANVALVVPGDVASDARGDAAGFFRRQLLDFPAVADRVDCDRTVRPVLTTGPFDRHSRTSTSDGVLLVGDAADFFDPFTGEGILSALRGAELAATTIIEALAEPGPVTARRLASYRAARRRAFLGKWFIERLIGYGMLAPALFDRAIGRLDRRGMADTLIGVTGGMLPASKVVNPGYLLRMLA
jgi:menaquinone-9 beta-reductase